MKVGLVGPETAFSRDTVAHLRAMRYEMVAGGGAEVVLLVIPTIRSAQAALPALLSEAPAGAVFVDLCQIFDALAAPVVESGRSLIGAEINWPGKCVVTGPEAAFERCSGILRTLFGTLVRAPEGAADESALAIDAPLYARWLRRRVSVEWRLEAGRMTMHGRELERWRASMLERIEAPMALPDSVREWARGEVDRAAEGAAQAGIPFGYCYLDWLMLDRRQLPGDELWEYDSGGEMWAKLVGRAGVALVRDGRIIGVLTTAMS